MTKKDISMIAIRILAIYMILQALQSLTFFAASTLRPGDSFRSCIYQTIPLAVGIFLWLVAHNIAGFMLSDGSSIVSTSFTLEALETSLVSLSGLFMFIYAVPSLLAGLFGAHPNFINGYPEMEKAIRLQALIVYTINAMVGIALMLASTPIVKAMHKLRDVRWIKE